SLPDDDKAALQVINLLLAHGVNARFRRQPDGKTAAQVARERNLTAAADRLALAEQETVLAEASPSQSPEVSKLESLARDMIAAYVTGDAESMRRINEHYGRNASVEDLRAIVWRLLYKVRQAGGSSEAFGIAEAQETISRTAGFSNWKA